MAEEENKTTESQIEIPNVRTLNLLYTNDIMGEAEQMAYLATVVKQVRASESYTLLVDSGNWAQGTLLSDQFKGMPMVEVMGAIGYEAVGIGKGEISFGSQNLYSLEDEAGFPILCCNLVEEGTGIPPYFLEKKFITLEKGPFKIAITGITAPGEYPGSGLKGKDHFKALPGVLEEIENEKPDVIILLSTIGLERDKAVARAFPQINVIVGGGDGLNLKEPVKQGDTYIVQSGERAQFLGSLAIDLEATIRITSVE